MVLPSVNQKSIFLSRAFCRRSNVCITPCKQVPPPVLFSIFSQPTSQVTNLIQENPLPHPQRPIASGEGIIRIPLHCLVESCPGYLLIPYFLQSDGCSQRWVILSLKMEHLFQPRVLQLTPNPPVQLLGILALSSSSDKGGGGGKSGWRQQ
jgi:hypothetical protein